MSVTFRCRVDPSLLEQTKQVTKEIGTNPSEVVKLVFTQLVKRRRIPFELAADARQDELLDVERRNQVWRQLDDTEGW